MLEITFEKYASKESDDNVQAADGVQANTEPSVNDQEWKERPRVIVRVLVKLFGEYDLLLGRSNRAKTFQGAVRVNQNWTSRFKFQ